MSWLVYRLTGSAMLLGIVGFTSLIPNFFITPLAGVLADRWNRRRLLIVTQILALIQAAALAAAVMTGIIQVWQIILFSLLLGVVNAFEIPLRQAFVVEMVSDREDLGNAIALNSSMLNSARLIGPAIAGLLVAATGEGICFIINSISYLAVIMALLAMRVEPVSQGGRARRRILHELREGFAYTYGFESIRSILLLLALVSLMGMPYTVLVPIFAKEILGGGAQTFGFLMTASGCGALAGSLYLASRKTILGLGRVAVMSTVLFTMGIVSFALSSSMLISLTSIAVAGFGIMTLLASGNTILQTILAEEMRGRVMSFFTMSIIGIAPFGFLGAGAMADTIGTRETLLLGASFCLLGALLYAKQLPHLREKPQPSF